MADQSIRTTWGRTTFGGGRIAAMTIAVPGGAAIGALLGVLAASLGAGGSSPLLVGIVFAVCLAFPATMLVYILVVDRSTIIGAADLPEDSVEFGWYEKAAAGALTDIVLVAGLAATVLAFSPQQISLNPSFLLVGVVALAFVSVAVRYILQRRRG